MQSYILGKSFTVFGPSSIFENTTKLSKESAEEKSLVGLVPRIMDYIYNHISHDNVNRSYLAKCSFFEIYQERVIDLLDANCDSSAGLPVREDSKLGVFVDGLKEELVKSTSDVNRILGVGYNNRHVGETNMNRESSRSHAVFVLTVNRTEKVPSGDDFIVKNVVSRLTLVDLAGSERQKNTNALGDRLKEASQINKSLTILGQVINSLVDGQIHIPFRDSKLTFLLRDSLGGNSKTVLIATISQSEQSIPESISTLKFAQRVKNIKTKAFVNEDTSGSVGALQKEISNLKAKLMEYESNKKIPSILSLNSAPVAFESNAMDTECKMASAEIQDKNVGKHSMLSEMRRHIEKLQQDTNIYSELVSRCNISDKSRLEMEAKFNGSVERIKFLEKSIMGLKMQLKMKEKQPLKPGEPAVQNNADELMKVALDTLRSEMQQEIAKFRYPLEQYEKSLSEGGNSVSLLNSFWTPVQETKVMENLTGITSSIQEQVSELQNKVNGIIEENFVSLCGIAPMEAISNRHLLQEKLGIIANLERT